MAALLLGPACTRDNPAFGDDSDGTDAASGSAEHGEAGDTEAGDHDSTTRADETEGDPLDTGDTSSSLDDGTDGIDICQLPLAKPPFTVERYVDNQEQAPSCGSTFHARGTLVSTEDNRLWISHCDDGTCSCSGQGQLTAYFIDINPAPHLYFAQHVFACLELEFRRTSEEDGCVVEWLTISERSNVGQRETAPLLVAVNDITPAFITPAITLGEWVEGCEKEECSRTPGSYSLQANGSTFGPGASDPMALAINDDEAFYTLRTMRSMVDEHCVQHISWSGARIE